MDKAPAQLIVALKKQIEFYFSDSNLRNDKFLKSLISQHTKGYVDLHIFLNFNKIKNIFNTNFPPASSCAFPPTLFSAFPLPSSAFPPPSSAFPPFAFPPSSAAFPHPSAVFPSPSTNIPPPAPSSLQIFPTPPPPSSLLSSSPSSYKSPHATTNAATLGFKIECMQKAIMESEILKLSKSKKKVRRHLKFANDPKDDRTIIYVENFPNILDHEGLGKVFEKAGKVLHVSIPKYGETKAIKGFAFIEFQVQ